MIRRIKPVYISGRDHLFILWGELYCSFRWEYHDLIQVSRLPLLEVAVETQWEMIYAYSGKTY